MARKPRVQGLWRSGRSLIVVGAPRFPDRCVCCGREADGRLRARFSWHHPAVYLALLAGVVIFMVLSLSLSRHARLEVPLCPRHRRVRLAWLAAGWLIVGASLVPALIGVARLDPRWGLVGALVLLLGLFVLLFGPRVMRPTRITGYPVCWFRGVSPAFLEHLPPATDHRRGG